MIWHVIKKTGRDIWDESLSLIIYNLIWVVGTVLILPWPFVTFCMVYIVKDIGEGRGVKISKFFNYGRENWKAAYIWGGINIVAYFLFYVNIAFYSGFNESWARVLQLFFVGLVIIWSILQLLTLTMYPRLVEPGFKLALRNAAVITARYPLMVIVLVGGTVLVGVTLSFLPLLVLLLAVAVIAMLASNTVDAVLERELDRRDGEQLDPIDDV